MVMNCGRIVLCVGVITLLGNSFYVKLWNKTFECYKVELCEEPVNACNAQYSMNNIFR